MRKLIVLIAMLSIASAAAAQQHIEWRKDKVTQVIFPAEITKFRTGYTSDCALTQSDGRVLYIQPISEMEETNINVMTSDGNYYSFNMLYNHAAAKVNYIVAESMAIFNDAPQSEPELAATQQSKLVKTADAAPDKKQTTKADTDQGPYSKLWQAEDYIMTNNVVKMQKLGVMLKAVYVDSTHIYFKFSLENSSNIPFDVDYIAFSITAKTTKRTSTQERIQIIPTAIDRPVSRVGAKSTSEVLYVFEKFTIGKDKILLSEVLEQGGDRNIGLKINQNFIINARKL